MSSDLEKCKKAVSSGGDFLGSFAGGALGGIIAGPIGAGIGSAAGTALGKIFSTIGNEISERVLSKRESVRIGAAMAYAIDRLREIESSGKTVRADLLNESKKNEAQELIEGVFQKSKEQYEERKIEFLGYFYANVLCNEKIEFYESFHLLKIFESLSWHQLLIAATLNQPKKNGFWKVRDRKRKADPHEWIILSEINELVEKNIIRQLNEKGEHDLYWGLGAIQLEMLSFTRLGLTFVEMFSLQKIKRDDMKTIIDYLSAQVVDILAR